MPIPKTELTVDFRPIAPDAPEDALVPFSVRNEGTGESWSEGEFRCPLDEQARGEMRWYLEEYWQWPFGPFRDRAHGIEARLEGWGRDLFNGLFDARQPARIYEHFLNEKADVRTLTIVSDAPRVMRLPWELLAESTGPLFTKRPPISIRRRVRLEHAADVRRFTLPLRVLFVSARPEGAGFVDPRSVARGLLNALETLGGAVEVDFLRPPTLAALDKALRRADEDGDRSRPYHIVHFDGHGVYHGRTGLGQLAFEHDDCSVDLVDANRLGTLLNECGVPLVILNACQSAQGDQSNPFSSIATRLLEAGVGGVLSMSHSVLVVTAARFIAAFYESLVRGQPVGRATDEARRVLVRDTRRHALAPRPDAPEEVIHLHDWFLPVLYQQRADGAPFAEVEAVRTHPPATIPQPLVSSRVPGGLPPDPLHGFHGRARELLQLERLFRDHPVVVLHGYGGQGKTALAAEAARWLHRTGRFPRGAAFVSFEQGAGAELALSWTRQALLGDDFATAEQVTAALRERPGLIIFDNFESVLPRGDLSLHPADLQELLDGAWKWVGGNDRNVDADGPRLLITTRDTGLGDPRYAPSRRCTHLELGGLAGHEALELAKAVLADRGIDHAAIPRQPLARLMDFLGGHPLSLYLVLPHLQRYTPDELIAEFDQLLPGFTKGSAKERNESLTVSLDFSLRRLGEETRQALPALTVFQVGACEAPLVQVTGFTFQVWDVIRNELVQAGLASLDDTGAILGTEDASHEKRASSIYVKFHPTLLPYLAPLLAPERRTELETRYRQAYHTLASYLYREDTKNPHFARALASRDLPNLRRALDLTLARAAALPPDDPSTGSGRAPSTSSGQAYAALETAADFAECVAKFLDYFGLRRERERLQARLDTLMEQRGIREGGALTRAEYLALSRRGEGLLSAGCAREAGQLFRALLNRFPPSPPPPQSGGGLRGGGDGPGEGWAYERAVTLGSLGRALKAQGRPAEAADLYRQKLSALESLLTSPPVGGIRGGEAVKRETGAAHTDLADALRDLGRYAEARAEYEASLNIAREIDDTRQAAVNMGQLGTLALRRRDYAGARRRYTEALAAFQALGEPGSEAVLWHQLGMVAQEQRDWDEAERCYRESLRLSEAGNNLAGVANTANQLGLVCEGAGRPAEAETWYRRALDAFHALGDRRYEAVCANNLAALLLDVEPLPPAARPAPFTNRDLLAEAEEYALRSAETMEAIGDPSLQIWEVCFNLTRIAERQGRPDEARRWRRREQESFAAFAGAGAQLPRWVEPVVQAVVAACEGSAEARKAINETLGQLAETDDWRNLPPVIRHILDGERDLATLTDGLDRIDALIVRRILEALAAPPQSPPTLGGKVGEEEPSPRPAGTPPPKLGEGTGEGAQEAITLEQVFGLVEAGCRGNTQAGQLAYGLVTQGLQAPGNPPEIRALGKTLQRILEGLRGEEPLAGLPAELRPPVEELLRRVGQ